MYDYIYICVKIGRIVLYSYIISKNYSKSLLLRHNDCNFINQIFIVRISFSIIQSLKRLIHNFINNLKYLKVPVDSGKIALNHYDIDNYTSRIPEGVYVHIGP